MDQELKNKIEGLIKQDKVFLFMKGTHKKPMCDFSMLVADVLKKNNINFKSFNVLLDNEIREGIKEYSDWPTIPQLYINEKLVGGADIVSEIDEKGELQKLV